MKKIIFLSGAASLMTTFVLACPVLTYASNSTFKLNISPQVCVVDIIEDGNNQTLQTPASCENILPNLLPVVQELLSSKTFPVAALSLVEDSLLGASSSQKIQNQNPASAINSNNKITETKNSAVLIVVTGIGLLVVASFGLDALFLESTNLKKTINWFKKILSK